MPCNLSGEKCSDVKFQTFVGSTTSIDEEAEVSGRDREEVDRRRRRGEEPATDKESVLLLDAVAVRDTLALVKADEDATLDGRRAAFVLDEAAEAVAVAVEDDDDCCCC